MGIKNLPAKTSRGRLLEEVAELAAAAELRLELLNAACGVDKTLLAGEGGVRIGGDIANHNLMLDTINGFGLAAAHRRAGQEFCAGGHVHKSHRI